MSETSDAVPQALADLDQREKDVRDFENEFDDDIDGRSEDDFEQQERTTLQVREDAANRASFTVRHGLQDVDPGISKKLVQAGIVVAIGAALVTLRRLFRRKPKLCIDDAWAWTTGQRPAPPDRMDLSRPLLGYSIGVAEKCVPLPAMYVPVRRVHQRLHARSTCQARLQRRLLMTIQLTSVP